MAAPVATLVPREGTDARVGGIRPGTYMTDEINLFCCISVDRSGDPDATMLVEDCFNLEVVIVALTDLPALGLRLLER